MIRFEHLGNTLQFTSPAQYPYSRKWSLVQSKERSASGKIYIESYPVIEGLLGIVFREMPQVDYNNLVLWFLEEVNGMEKEFVMIDDLDALYTVRFADPILNFKLTDFELWEGSFDLEIV